MDGVQVRSEERDDSITGGASFTMHGNFKLFARAVIALNRVGEHLYLEPNAAGLALRSLNCSKSAYAAVFFSTTFFAVSDTSNIGDSQYNQCRISMKCALAAFKSSKNVDRAVTSCRLHINPVADAMLVQLTLNYDVVKSHEIPFLECTTAFKNVVNRADLVDSLVIPSILLSSVLEQMDHKASEVMFCAKPDSFLLKNYSTGDVDAEKMMKTEAKMGIGDMIRYSVPKATEVTVNMKEVKAFVSFAEAFKAPVSVYFDEPGRPLVVALESDVNYTVELVVASVDFESTIIDPMQVEEEEALKGVNAIEGELHEEEESIVNEAAGNGHADGLMDVDGSPRPSPSSVDRMNASTHQNPPSTSQSRAKEGAVGRERSVQGISNPDNQEVVEGDEKKDEDGSDLDTLSASPSPPANKKFRRYFLASSQQTMHASQLFADKTVIARDSDNEE